MKVFLTITADTVRLVASAGDAGSVYQLFDKGVLVDVFETRKCARYEPQTFRRALDRYRELRGFKPLDSP